MTVQQTTSPRDRLGAALVHVYTASGAVIAFLMVLAAFQGDAIGALWLGLAALIIDSTDGTLARRFRVSETIPWFDGRRLDDIVDYLTYVFAPVLLLWSGGYLPAGLTGICIAAMPLLASSYQFCRVDAKTDDHFFLGFPSYWNVVAFYVIVFQLAPATVSAILTLCALLVFVPIRYLYPSRTVAFRPLTLLLTAIWLVCYALILRQQPEPAPVLTLFSLLYLVYYVGLSLYLTLRARDADEPALGEPA
ncbi:CDP-alcohol phosphatidyltransferase family protein [Kallotenue papyrolyticum]|uniref:CDP-alcohol phosphatidyltransferase family protein n=1 Tax=Kallotenue papyrolyticum TaxID=1325125 RepID=UPI00047858E5|nr:CDP-alcohol phosphatidyltransferase family protein [Kallotenue papyrolyticum]